MSTLVLLEIQINPAHVCDITITCYELLSRYTKLFKTHVGIMTNKPAIPFRCKLFCNLSSHSFSLQITQNSCWLTYHILKKVFLESGKVGSSESILLTESHPTS